MGDFLQIVLLNFLAIPCTNAAVTSVYPCVWKDEATSAVLDLQLFESMTISGNAYNGNYTYSPCSNNVEYNGEWYMLITYIYNGEYTQPITKWDNGTTVPIYNNGKWTFGYTDTNIECISNHSLQMSVNITWYYGGSLDNVYTITPIVNINTYYQCFAVLNAQSVVIYDKSDLYNTNDTCILPFYSTTSSGKSYIRSHLNFSAFRSYVFNASYSNRQIFYSPCRDAITCNGYLAQATLNYADPHTKNCTYLSVFAGYGPTYCQKNGSYNIYWNDNQYYDFNTNSDAQLTEIVYKNGENCSISESETVSSKFYVYWQCNTLAKPYANVRATSEVVCMETLSIDSIYACPDFAECIYSDQDHTLNLTGLVGTYFVIQGGVPPNSYNATHWFYYSVCQNGLANQMNLRNVSQPSTLYNKFEFMSGIFTGPDTIGDQNSFSVDRIAAGDFNSNSGNYFFNSESNAWIFEYTNGRLCDTDSLFSVQWNCGYDGTSIVSYTETPCTVTLVLETDSC